jgi:magnesium transporter
MREMISRLSRADHPFIHEESRPYFRDLFDHIQQVIEQLEIQREVLYGIQELHLSEISYQMNRVMKVLTIITTIFVPLTFLAGIYGMNFKYMPELEYPYSYPALLVIMLVIVAGLLYYFKKKDWL